MRSFLARVLPPRPLAIPAAVSGILLTLAFPTTSVGWLAFVALVPVFAAAMRYRPERGDAFRTGFLLGFTWSLTMMWWIAKLIPSADVTIPWLMTPALVVLGLYLAVYPGFFLLICAALTRYRAAAFVLCAPAVWVLLEAVRSRGELAFPWGSLGYTLSDYPALIQWASVGGLPLLSFVVVLVNALFAAAFAYRRAAPRAACVAAALALVAVMAVSGSRAMSQLPEGDRTVRVAVVQPNVDLAVKWKPEFRDSTLRLIERLTVEAAGAGAELIIFPETSAPVYLNSPRSDARRYRATLTALAGTLEIPVYIGFLNHRFDAPDSTLNIYNSSGVFLPDGEIEFYEKNHLLPFGEALPGSRRWRALRRVDFGQANFEPGPPRAPLDAGTVSFTPLICFESVFPYLCRRGIREGAELLVNITNDGWFADTPGPYQHAQMSIMRAVEFRRWLVRSANSGVSMVVSPAGNVVDALPLFVPGMIIADVTALSGETFYARHGDMPALICSLVLMIGAFGVSRMVKENE